MHADFLAAIREEPDDLTHRLVFADWLVDHGTTDLDAARAELIHVQIARETADPHGDDFWTLRARERVLLAAWGETLAAEVGLEVRRVGFRRGFIERIEAEGAAFAAHGAEWRQRVPLRELRLLGEVPPLARGSLDHLAGLEVPWSAFAALATRLAEGHITGLRHLGLRPGAPDWRGPEDTDRAGLRDLRTALTWDTAPEALRSLRLFCWDDQRTCRIIPELLASPWLAQLQALTLDGFLSEDAPPLLRTLSVTPAAAGLRSLRLAVSPSPWGESSAGPHLDGLHELELVEAGERLGLPRPTVTQQQLLAWRFPALSLPNLRVLRLRGGWGWHPRVRAGAHLHTLELPDIAWVGYGPIEGFLPEHLRRLSLTLNDDDIPPLLAAREILPEQRLRELVLRNCRTSDKSLMELNRSKTLPGLTALEMPGYQARPITLTNLIDPTRSPRLAWLDLRGTPLPGDMQQRLRRRLGAGLRTGPLPKDDPTPGDFLSAEEGGV